MRSVAADDLGFESGWLEPSKGKAKQTKKRASQALDDGFFEGVDPQPKRKVPRQSARSKQLSGIQTGQADVASAMSASRSRAAVNLCNAKLKIANSVSSADTDSRQLTSYEVDGPDPDSVRERIKLAKSKCNCKVQCYKSITFAKLLQVCLLFWGLRAEERAMIVRETYHGGATHDDEDDYNQPKLKRVQWSLCEVPVCFAVFCHLLKTGPVTVRKQIKGTPDMRRSNIRGVSMPVTRNAEQARLIDTFFYELYQSAAEPLPEDFRCSEVRNQGVSIDDLISDSHQQQDPDFDFWMETPAVPAVSAVLQSSSLENPEGAFSVNLLTVACNTKVLGLPMRYLPHQRVSDLYWQYQAWWDNLKANGHIATDLPCYKTFLRRWSLWQKRLKFRKSSQHAQCNVCYKLQAVLHSHGTGWGEKVQAARELRQHYRDQYLDRCLYWSLRWFSRHSSEVLVIIIDSMDKAKFAWPRWIGRTPKTMDKLFRPKLVLTAALAHGYTTHLFLSSEQESHGSDAVCEMLSRTIEKVNAVCKKRGQPFPRHLVIQSDNTPAQCKNQFVTAFLAVLVARFKFVTATLNFLMVGHTHEDVDQLFALILWLLVRKASFQTPSEILAFLGEQLRPHICQRGEELVTEMLTGVRDYYNWYCPIGLHLHNCFRISQGGEIQGVFKTFVPQGQIKTTIRNNKTQCSKVLCHNRRHPFFGRKRGSEDKETPHSFAFKLGSCLDATEAAMLHEVLPDAVYCCVKTFMRDCQLQQPPELCIPRERALTILTDLPQGYVSRRPLTSTEISTCLSLAAAVLEMGLVQAEAALQDHVRVRRYALAPLSWLRDLQQPNMHIPDAGRNPYFSHLPASSWKLIAELQ